MTYFAKYTGQDPLKVAAAELLELSTELSLLQTVEARIQYLSAEVVEELIQLTGESASEISNAWLGLDLKDQEDLLMELVTRLRTHHVLHHALTVEKLVG